MVISGVLPSRDPRGGPWSEEKGLSKTPWRVTGRSKNWRSAARAIFWFATEGARPWMKNASSAGETSRSPIPLASHDSRKLRDRPDAGSHVVEEQLHLGE